MVSTAICLAEELYVGSLDGKHPVFIQTETLRFVSNNGYFTGNTNIVECRTIAHGENSHFNSKLMFDLEYPFIKMTSFEINAFNQKIISDSDIKGEKKWVWSDISSDNDFMGIHKAVVSYTHDHWSEILERSKTTGNRVYLSTQ